jgi:Ca2+-binding EF-hand superfamily protein
LAFDELNYALRSDFAIPGLTQGDVRRLFAAIDVDGSGEVSCDEFIDAIESVDASFT